MGSFWKSTIAKMIGIGFVLLGITYLALLWTEFDHAVVKAAGGEIIYVDARATGDGSSWENAFTDLHSAIVKAKDGDQIWIAAGTYYPTGNGIGRDVHFKLKNGVEIYGGFKGDEDPADFDLDERNFTMNETILSGDINQDGQFDGNAYHVIRNNGLDETAVLDGVTVRDGNADDGSSADGYGGGIHNDKSSPTLRNMIIRGNYADYHGGGMYNSDSNPVLTNVVISGNRSDFRGGGMYNTKSNPVLTNVTINGNSGLHGGGMYNINSNPVLTNVTISGNDRHGIEYNSSYLVLTNVLITGNEYGLFGGGSSDLVLTNVTVSGNKGYGIFFHSSNLTLRNSIVWTNGGENIQ